VPPRAAPAETPPVPPSVPPAPPRSSLVLPTLKALLALVVTTAVAAGLGAAIGLPLPLTGTNNDDTVAAAAAAPVNSTSTGAGPYMPVIGPVDYGEFAARFGGGRGHPGQDLLTKTGTPLIAVRSGTIVDGGTVNGPYSGGRGNYLYIWAPQDKRTYVYEHMQRPSPLHVGDSVVAGEYVGRVGCTGSCDGPHLHFEIRLGLDDFSHDPKPIDPLPLLKTWAAAPQQAISGSPDKRLAP
jgi:murein DD-endopeptidase MepM/ murein hydrolase activator NlpD